MAIYYYCELQDDYYNSIEGRGCLFVVFEIV